MPRRPREDAPDTWHHVMNRGIARRTLFETDKDRRFFLAAIAREVRAGRIEVHAFSLMLTHFHLLVRSVTGELSKSMRIVQNRYSRYFNRTRRRDGTLYRGRFLSRPIGDLRYRRRVATYIHDNPVAAAVVSDPADDEWCSAHHFALENRPRWLATGWIDEEVAARGKGGAGAGALAEAFPSSVDDEFREWIERQLSQRFAKDADELEDVTLKHAGSPRVVRCAMRKAKLADGKHPFRPVTPPRGVESAIADAKRKMGKLTGLFKRKTKGCMEGASGGSAPPARGLQALRNRRENRPPRGHDLPRHPRPPCPAQGTARLRPTRRAGRTCGPGRSVARRAERGTNAHRDTRPQTNSAATANRTRFRAVSRRESRRSGTLALHAPSETSRRSINPRARANNSRVPWLRTLPAVLSRGPLATHNGGQCIIRAWDGSKT